jgi:hypothetical protein
MKFIYSALLICMMATLSVTGQNSVQINIDHLLGGSEFALNVETPQNGYTFDISRLEYYISDIFITHDGGTITDIEDVWLLVNANESGLFNLGTWSIDNVEAISFYIGVGPDVNHDDPAAWPVSHPLYPQNPSMHWGWSSGYRFVALEGHSGPSSAAYIYEIHALGDNNYFQTSVAVSASASGGELVIPIMAEYANALDGIDLSSGVINHSTGGVSVPLLQNFSSDVFSPGVVSSLIENVFTGELSVSPNPSEGAALLSMKLPAGGPYTLSIIDMNGRIIENFQVNTTEEMVQLPELSSGLYLIELEQAGVPLAQVRWAVK